MIRLDDGNFGWDYILVDTVTGITEYYQNDWDYPYIAGMFGWVPCDDCGETDGTVSCKHKSVSVMIEEAHDFINDHIGTEVEGNIDG